MLWAIPAIFSCTLTWHSFFDVIRSIQRLSHKNLGGVLNAMLLSTHITRALPPKQDSLSVVVSWALSQDTECLPRPHNGSSHLPFSHSWLYLSMSFTSQYKANKLYSNTISKLFWVSRSQPTPTLYLLTLSWVLALQKLPVMAAQTSRSFSLFSIQGQTKLCISEA